MNRNKTVQMLRVEFRPFSHLERLVSGVGGVVAIAAIMMVSHALLGDAAVLIVASMGAATVLLFAVPHGPLSQPWPLFGGNLISALIGVTCAQLIAEPWLAAALAVGISVAVMYYLRCVHPPGGATALIAVIGGPSITALGYEYLLVPVLLNVVIIFVVALLFNFPFRWRRYPASLIKSEIKQEPLSHAGIAHALKQMDVFVDVSESDLKRIYTLATEFDRQQRNRE